MVEYYEFLYRPKQPNESELDKLSRRMAFKLPIVFRYNVGFAIIFGILHSVFAKNPKWMTRYMYLIPIGMVGLCYQEIWDYGRIQGYVNGPLPGTQIIEAIKPEPAPKEEKPKNKYDDKPIARIVLE